MIAFAVALIVVIGLAHSYLGERYILVRLFRQPLPRLFGSDEFTKRTLRFAWHVTTVAWFGLALVLWQIRGDSYSRSDLLIAIGSTFALTALIALAGSKGRHLSWLVFGAIAVACYLAA